MLPYLVIVFILTACTCGENPAIKIILTNKGLQYGRHAGAGWAQQSLKDLSVPDVSGGIHIRPFGTVGYTLTDMTVTQCDFPEPSIDFYQTVTGFKSTLPGLSAAVHGNWRINYGIIRDAGSFDLAVFNVEVTSVIELGRDASGHLSVSSVSCQATVGNVKLNLHGGGSWIVQPFVDKFYGHIRGKIEGNICPAVEQHILVLERRLQAINVSFQVNEALAVDIPLTDLPFIDDLSLRLDLMGKFYSVKGHEEPPFEAQPFTLPEQPDYMLSMGLSEFTANSASYGYFSAGQLQILINDSMIPRTSSFHLNTSSFGPFIPQLPKLFPGLLMEIQVYAKEAPSFCFQPGVVNLDFPAVVKAFAIQPNATLTPLFKLGLDSKFSGKVWIDSGRIKGYVAMDNLTSTLEESEIGTFKTAALEGVIGLGIKYGVLSKVNKNLTEGFALPSMQHAQLVNPVLNVQQGFLAILSDAEVRNPERS
ncbi:bactericidal permeability-increasing protein [Lampris incognitus]|uniref:bactericidal permeability-increasing protein n=1 Tax=Lampris incognitus TaxID=2546036 RepID=UPI0024B56480|nr:bactericidal permeability-increasing protein [Lampris incognitus]